MNNEIKLNLNITLPGRIMLSDEECSKNPETSYDYSTLLVTSPDGKRKTKLNIQTRKYRPASQSINLNSDAYYHMISNETPAFSTPKKWAKYSKKQRLELHLFNIMGHLGGINLSYTVFEN